MTIMEAVLQVMRHVGRPMTPQEVFAEIERGKLYTFRSRDPASVVRAQMRKHSLECPTQSAAATLYLKLAEKDRYEVLSTAVKRSSGGSTT